MAGLRVKRLLRGARALAYIEQHPGAVLLVQDPAGEWHEAGVGALERARASEPWGQWIYGVDIAGRAA